MTFNCHQVHETNTISASQVRIDRLMLLNILKNDKLTREDTATDGDISSEGAFLVNVSAVNSLVKTKSIISDDINTTLLRKQFHVTEFELHQHCHKALSSEPCRLGRPS